ncbi:MAG: CDP-diacylglycerol--glycerol-3-phosphate 3-phosphatidyltransferase [Gammaproteobacteria bacterium]|nr:CDP-diacylglycerol--glycerol-3-phosphate 3-phosphatidyltransferase [Gammaproteobacteria bacterium]
MNLPNILTLTRILLVPIYAIFFYLDVSWGLLAATIVYALAGFTDWLDGYLARKLNQASALGAFLDPVADKFMVAVALILLVDQNPTHFSGIYMSIAAVIIIGREITISALREWMAGIGARKSVAVSMIGKVKTTAQMFAIGFLTYGVDLWGLPISTIGFALLWMAVILTLWSMIDYIRAAWPQLSSSG